MKNNLDAQPAPEINFSRITVVANPADNNTQRPILIQNVTKKESAITANLVLVAGILFWAHGSATHDAWFKGEEIAGQAITGFYIGILGLMCCCACAAGCAAANAKDSETEISTSETSRAKRYLKSSTPRPLMTDIFEADDKNKNDITNDITNDEFMSYVV